MSQEFEERATRRPLAQRPLAKHTSAFIVAALGLVVGCGPIAFRDTINFSPPVSVPDVVAPDGLARTPQEILDLLGQLIQFEHDSAEITPESHGLLDEVVKILQDNPQVEQLDIVGHTSFEGSKAHNDKLSTDRAASVKQYLIDKGIDTARLTSQGKGPSDPVASNDTEEGKIANRRVEFEVTKMNGAVDKSGAR
jgi:outer membrane protein OmpA-like peptidoglycan-associated protein